MANSTPHPDKVGSACRAVPAWLVRLGPWVFVLALALHVVTIVLWPNAHWNLIDMRTYRGGAQHLVDGQSLYNGPVFLTLNFIYPPFAAILFLPLTLLSTSVDKWLTFTGELALLYFAGRHCWRRMTTARGGDLVKLSLLTAGLGLWMDPIRITTYLGQINTLLLALVVADLYRTRGRFGGVGLGIAAGIKLTPLIFLPFLLVTRRFRDAAVAVGVFVATALVSLAVTPSNTVRYWIDGAFHNAGRITDPGSVSNQSINGALIRIAGHGHGETLLWLACAGLVAVAGIGLAALAYHRNQSLLALALVGMTGSAVSPYSWNHHWVWVFGLLLWLLALGGRKAYLAAGVLYLACLGFLDAYPPPSDTWHIPLSGWQYLPVNGWPRLLLDNTWILIYLGVILVTAWWLRSGSTGSEGHDIGDTAELRARTPAPAA